MGCDEHLYVERWREGEWVPVDPPDEDSWALWLRPEEPIHELAKAFEKDPYPMKANSWHLGRDYRTYGFLAGVRVIDIMFKEPEGFPEDASPQVRGAYEDWLPDAHTPTTYTLEELLEYVPRAAAEFHLRHDFSLKRLSSLYRILSRVAEHYGLTPDRVRIIIWFDN